MLTDLGLTVVRQIPIDTIAGFASRAYTLHGGVVRDAGGRIVSHLVSSGAPSALASLAPGVQVLSSLLQSGQLWRLSKDVATLQTTVNTVLTVASAGAALSGLGLITSIAGFVYLSKRLAQVDVKLAEIARDTKDIKDWLASLQKSNLQFAIDNLRHAETANSKALRQDMLLQSKREFSTLSHLYKEQWARCRAVPEIQAVSELYTLAILGHATVCSDLGMTQEAANDLQVNCLDWSTQARLHVMTQLFTDRPDRLLGAEYVERLPSKTLAKLMDFAHGTERGIDWLDDLRTGREKNSSVLDRVSTTDSARAFRIVGKGDSLGLVGMAEALAARSDALDATVAHYRFLDAKRVGATEFQRLLHKSRQDSGAEAICVVSSPPRSRGS